MYQRQQNQTFTHTIVKRLQDDYGKTFPIGTHVKKMSDWENTKFVGVKGARFLAKGHMIFLFSDEVDTYRPYTKGTDNNASKSNYRN